MNTKPAADNEPLLASIQGALQLIERHGGTVTRPLGNVAQLPSLLDQCRYLYEQNLAAPAASIRTIHHFACTGGSLISKCIAAMPNTLVLSEMDPLSHININPDAPDFAPTDILKHMKYSRRTISDDDLLEVFLGGLTALQSQCHRVGRRLVLRDHAHSHYCWEDKVGARPALDEIIARISPLRSVVTLRHPLDSYLSLSNNGWMHFVPGTINEYALRYHAFLDHYEGTPWLRYEDFVRKPQEVMSTICKLLDLAYEPSFIDLLSALPISGDSGRTSSTLTLRPRRNLSETIESDARASTAFLDLLQRMDYQWDVVTD